MKSKNHFIFILKEYAFPFGKHINNIIKTLMLFDGISLFIYKYIKYDNAEKLICIWGELGGNLGGFKPPMPYLIWAYV